jgi:hypothetical protein
MAVSAANLSTFVSGVRKILNPVAMAGATQRLVGQPKIL